MTNLRFDDCEFRYQQYYCEENIWYLCQEPRFNALDKRIVFISNDTRRCLFRYQRICKLPERPVWWDYHVILMCDQKSWMVWDLDTMLGLPITASDYFKETFGEMKAIEELYPPRFRIVDAAEFVRTFSSDRSHMLSPNGAWIAPPPMWSPIINGDRNTLDDFVNTNKGTIGEILSLEDVYNKFSL